MLAESAMRSKPVWRLCHNVATSIGGQHLAHGDRMARDHHSLQPTADALCGLARQHIDTWVGVDVHPYVPLYCWRDTPTFNAFGEQTGALKANTIYLCDSSPTPVEDLFHEIGHVVARRFDLLGHRHNGFIGAWEQRQKRLVGTIGSGRHWSHLLNQIRRSAPGYTPDLASEVWAELFMCWYLYPEIEETAFIKAEMGRIKEKPEMETVTTLAYRLSSSRE